MTVIEHGSQTDEIYILNRWERGIRRINVPSFPGDVNTCVKLKEHVCTLPRPVRANQLVFKDREIELRGMHATENAGPVVTVIHEKDIGFIAITIKTYSYFTSQDKLETTNGGDHFPLPWYQSPVSGSGDHFVHGFPEGQK